MAELYFLGNSTMSQMLGIIIQSSDKTVVIDGGTPGGYLQLASFIKEKAKGCVDAWFFTHPHHDHIGAFVELCKNCPEIQIDKILCNFPTTEQLKEFGTRTDYEVQLWNSFDKLISDKFKDSFHKVQKGEVFSFDEIKIHVLRVFNEKITANFINNSSAVYRIDSPRKRVLILGDLGVEGGDEVMAQTSAQELHADYTQMAHHGQSGVSKEFYKYIEPKACLWAAPDWLWDNNKGDGYNTGPWKTLETREWMQELGVTEHIIQKDGTAKIEL